MPGESDSGDGDQPFGRPGMTERAVVFARSTDEKLRILARALDRVEQRLWDAEATRRAR